MDRKTTTRMILGLILILLGGWFLAAQWYPQLAIWESFNITWPFIVIGVGILLYFLGLLGGEPDMMVPATVVTGIGGILYYQDRTGDWESWSYVWALIPGFVGLGTLLAALLKGSMRQVRDGLSLIIISMILFAIFSTFLGGLSWTGLLGAAALILLGIYLIVTNILRRPEKLKPTNLKEPVPEPSPAPEKLAGEEAQEPTRKE